MLRFFGERDLELLGLVGTKAVHLLGSMLGLYSPILRIEDVGSGMFEKLSFCGGFKVLGFGFLIDLVRNSTENRLLKCEPPSLRSTQSRSVWPF